MGTPDLIDIVTRSLKKGPVSIEQLIEEHTSLWNTLGWDAGQVRLWLACTGGLSRWRTGNGRNRLRELVALLNEVGRPMPMAQLMGKLPSGMMVTEPMVCGAAQKDARQELKGPFIKLA